MAKKPLNAAFIGEMSFNQIYGMIIRQFRLILQALGRSSMPAVMWDVTKTLHPTPFVAKKISMQARQFDFPTFGVHLS